MKKVADTAEGLFISEGQVVGYWLKVV